ncbi:MAG: methylmalonyl-CoA mutase [Proteobacteria bacterium]|nr:MAG: methylmalonyl-CoA mutase [Pseudomonadota bacterium]
MVPVKSAARSVDNSPVARAERPYKLRFVTAASLFDGHDASINIMRRILQSSGVEVIHLGHNRSVREIVEAAVQEDAQGIAVSSYQGGHVEYFKYMVDVLRENNCGHVKVFGGGGGVIVPSEIDALHAYGVARVYSPEDGQRMGLQGMIDDMLERADHDPASDANESLRAEDLANTAHLARLISLIENGSASETLIARLDAAEAKSPMPVLGITGTGGSGKSSLTDELILRIRLDYADALRVALVAIDPSRRKTGGALLGDRIRMNAIDGKNIFMRSMATRDSESEVPPGTDRILKLLRLAGFDLAIVETPGIGQGNSGIANHVDLSMYVMTPEFGAASQLEKIDMLDFADIVAINKSDRKGAEDALRDVRKQVQRNRTAFDKSTDDMPVFATTAAHFNDHGVTELYFALQRQLVGKGLAESGGVLRGLDRAHESSGAILPPSRQRYLSEISETLRRYHERSALQADVAHRMQQIEEVAELVGNATRGELEALLESTRETLDTECRELLDSWPEVEARYTADEFLYKVRDREIRIPLTYETLSGTQLRKVSLPKFRDRGDLLAWLRRENLPGYFPFTAGVFPLKREGEDPTRMFAGEGDPFRTNRRFKYLSEGFPAKRLSTAFDSVTLYGADPDERPDIYGKIGTSGVSIATLDDMRELYRGFDLCSPSTSVSMTINGPAPTVLAMFFNTAIDQQAARFEKENGRPATVDEYQKLRRDALRSVRGTVQADILKEDQGQNTCLFSTEFSLRLMGDIQQYFIDNEVRNFYSVSISGYHIAEAGANPISQLAFTLSNGFTYVESYLARGMEIDDFAPNLSFFFSNGMDPEYSVLGRVARRIWAVAMRDRYGASERSQKLKYHIQTSGRSLHAQEMAFNDIRTTLQALIAVYDNCNSLHTNAHDEAITTPSESSVRRAVAIQKIINEEWGVAHNQNPNQGSFVIEELTDLVEEAVLTEFERISERGGVLGAMETGYQRGRIQEESMRYEHRKHDGSYPIIGVNTYLNESDEPPIEPELSRASEEEKQGQLRRLREFHDRNAEVSEAYLDRLMAAAVRGENVFAELMDTVRHCSLGQITEALFQVGGKYRRNM